ncbi:MAG: hypothetical protein LBP55_06570 [Candidatus Adiutrix sp.]|jgi:hypothetical protein|nr:hypothetical protein [Candidatus Adiutrix sp.]
MSALSYPEAGRLARLRRLMSGAGVGLLSGRPRPRRWPPGWLPTPHQPTAHHQIEATADLEQIIAAILEKTRHLSLS